MRRFLDSLLTLLALIAAAFFLLSIVEPAAYASSTTGTAHVEWTLSTTCSDGSAASGCPTVQTNLYSCPSTSADSATATCSGGGAKARAASISVPATSFDFVGTPIGNWCLEATQAMASGVESDHTHQACLTVLPDLVTGTTQVYYAVQQPNGFAFLQVGTVPIGTKCDPTQRVNGFNVVPRELVSWSGTLKPLAVLGVCQ